MTALDLISASLEIASRSACHVWNANAAVLVNAAVKIHTAKESMRMASAMNQPRVSLDSQSIALRIRLIRGEKVMLLDSDLAELCGVSTSAFNQAVMRNAERLPADFMFQLSADEHGAIRSQTVTLKAGRGQHRKCLPYAFTELGAEGRQP